MPKKALLRVKTLATLLIVLTLFFLALLGPGGEQPLLAAGCCEDCDPAFTECADSCAQTCGADQACYDSCMSICRNQRLNCFRHCDWCEYGCSFCVLD